MVIRAAMGADLQHIEDYEAFQGTKKYETS
jgi:hypothetical protein